MVESQRNPLQVKPQAWSQRSAQNAKTPSKKVQPLLSARSATKESINNSSAQAFQGMESKQSLGMLEISTVKSVKQQETGNMMT